MAAYTETVTYGPSSVASGDGVVTLPYSCVSYSARIEYDSTGRSVAGYNLTFRGTSWIISNISVEDQGDKLRAVIDAFKAPRGVFRWYYEGSGQTSYFEVTGLAGAGNEVASNTYVDRRNGPRARVISAERTNAGFSAKITWEIETFIAAGCDLPADMDEFSWGFSYALDQDFNTTRNVRGIYRFRSATTNSIAVSLLGVGGFWPRLPTGFYRSSITHQLSTDGLTLEWAIADKQVWRTLPRPLTSGRASMHASLQGAVLTKSMDCEFGAPVDVSKSAMLDFIITLIRYRFPDAFNGSKLEYITGLEFSDNMFENRVGCRVTSRTPPTKGSEVTDPNIINTNSQTFLRALFGDIAQVVPISVTPGWSASNGSTELRSMVGTAGLAPTATLPFDLCSTSQQLVNGSEVFASTNLSSDQQVSNTAPNSMSGPGNQNTSVPAAPAGQTPQLSVQQSTNPYIYFHEETHWQINRNLEMIPIMASTGASTANYSIQQTAPPKVTIIQAGSARRYGAMPNIPQPPFAGVSGALCSEEHFSPTPPKLLADGTTWEYGISYSRVVIVPPLTSIPAVYVPINPQLDYATYSTPLTNEPNLAGVPQPSASTDGVYSPDVRYT